MMKRKTSQNAAIEETFGKKWGQNGQLPECKALIPVGWHCIENKWGHTLICTCVAAAYR
jgi:hypothetical protein